MWRICKLLSLLLSVMLMDFSGGVHAQEANAENYAPGILITRVTKRGPAAQAGLVLGDLLLSLDGNAVRFVSQIAPFLDAARWDGKKSIELRVRRGTANLTLSMPPLSHEFSGRPPLSATVQALYDQANSLPKSRAHDIAAKLKAAAEAARMEGDARAAEWLWREAFNPELKDAKADQETLTEAVRSGLKAGDVLGVANTFVAMGTLAYSDGDNKNAELALKQARMIQDDRVPHTLNYASTIVDLGAVAYSARDFVPAEIYWKIALEIWVHLESDSSNVAVLLDNLTKAAKARGNLDKAMGYALRALAIRERLIPHSAELSYAITDVGRLAATRGKLDEAIGYFKRALTIQQAISPESMDVASSLNNLGAVAYQRSKLDEAERYLRHALKIQERLGPHSLVLASILNNLGNLAESRGKLNEAEAYQLRSLDIRWKKDPRSLDVAASVVNLANVQLRRGFLDIAEKNYKTALSLLRILAPDTMEFAAVLMNLGTIAHDRGQLDASEEAYRSALIIEQRLAPDSLEVAGVLNNLGNVAYDRGKSDVAETYYKRSLAIKTRLAPDSLDVAASLNGLGNLASGQDNLSGAETYYKSSYEIYQRLAPGSLDAAARLVSLGQIADARSKYADADRDFRSAWKIFERLAPDSLDAAGILANLGTLEIDLRKFDNAEGYLVKALKTYRRLAPGSLGEATILENMGQVAENRGKLDEAEGYFHKAWDIVRRQGRQISGDSGRQSFGKANIAYAANLVNVQLERKKPEEAFVTLEEGRAQALVQAIAEPKVTGKLVPPAVWHSFQQAEMAHNVAYKDVERSMDLLVKARGRLADAKEQKSDQHTLEEKRRELEAVQKTLEKLHTEEVRVGEEMASSWTTVLRAAKASLPPPMDPNQARKRLAPGTLFLEFSVGRKTVTLFVATAENVQVWKLQAPREELEAKVKFIRRYLTRSADDRGAELVQNADQLQDALRTLFLKLFPPDFQKSILQAKRIVLSPDDFLWDLPFAALIPNSSGAPSYLGLEKPLSYAQSLTLYFTPGPKDVTPGHGAIVIGNPIYSNEIRKQLFNSNRSANPTTDSTIQPDANRPDRSPRDGELGMMTPDGLPPPQLPFAEEEAKNVANLYDTSAHIGIEPTEAWLREHAEQAQVLHLATHGRFNPRAPQSSGVLLAVPEQTSPPGQYDNDGTLQAWEIWSLKLRADLVVLSACETGRGVSEAGEGLIGLTRALQYAGARTVVSSLWSINDASTSELMVSFHSHLRAGLERDEALRMAMRDLATSGKRDWSSPYHWAAFLLVGDTGKMP